MLKGQVPILFGAFIVLVLIISACDVFSSPLELSAVPVYTGAERIDPSENSFAALRYNQDQKWIVSGHKAAVNAYVLPKGTTSGQVKAFYSSRLSPLGKVQIMMGDNEKIGSIDIDRGFQSFFIFFSANTESPSPILLIENYIVNGCAHGGTGCTAGPRLIHSCLPGSELQTITSSRPNDSYNGTVYTSTDYCYDSAGKRSNPLNAYEPNSKAP